MKNPVRCTLAGLLATLAATSATARDSAEVSVSLTVPLVCHVNIIDTRDTETGAVARLQEFCNSGRGFRVWMDGAGLDDDARVFYEGMPVSRVGGRFLLIDAPGARRRESEIEIVMARPANARLRLELEPPRH